MRNLLERKYSVWLSIITFLFGTNLIYHQSYIRIIEPPARYCLIGWLLFWSLAKIITVFLGKKRLSGYALVFMSMGWVFITWLYLIHPVKNNAWLFSIAILGVFVIVMYRGDFRR